MCLKYYVGWRFHQAAAVFSFVLTFDVHKMNPQTIPITYDLLVGVELL